MKLRTISTFAISIAMLAIGIASPAAAAPADPVAAPLLSKVKAARFALVIGSNRSLDKKQAPLRYADDDAAKVATLLREAGVDVELLTQLDRDSQASFPDIPGNDWLLSPPSRQDRKRRRRRRME